MHVQAYLYDGYWEDIGTIEAFYEANLALTDSPTPDFRRATCRAQGMKCSMLASCCMDCCLNLQHGCPAAQEDLIVNQRHQLRALNTHL